MMPTRMINSSFLRYSDRCSEQSSAEPALQVECGRVVAFPFPGECMQVLRGWLIVGLLVGFAGAQAPVAKGGKANSQDARLKATYTADEAWRLAERGAG